MLDSGEWGRRTHHHTHAIHNVLCLLDLEESLARDLMTSTVVAVNLQDAHAGVYVYLAATWPSFFVLFRGTTDDFRGDVPPDGACVADVDSLRHRKLVALLVFGHAAIACKLNQRGALHDT